MTFDHFDADVQADEVANVNEPCRYCGQVECPMSDDPCDGYAGDIDGLYSDEDFDKDCDILDKAFGRDYTTLDPQHRYNNDEFYE